MEYVFADRRLLLSILYHLNLRDFYCFLSVLPRWTAKRIGPKLLEMEEFNAQRSWSAKEAEHIRRVMNSALHERIAHYDDNSEDQDEFLYLESRNFLLYVKNRGEEREIRDVKVSVLERAAQCDVLRRKIKGYLV